MSLPAYVLGTVCMVTMAITHLSFLPVKAGVGGGGEEEHILSARARVHGRAWHGNLSLTLMQRDRYTESLPSSPTRWSEHVTRGESGTRPPPAQVT